MSTLETATVKEANEEHENSGQEWRKHYRLVVAALLGIGLGLSPLPYYTLIVLSEPLMAEFGWTRGNVFGALFFITLGIFVTSPIVGYFTDNFGARRTALVSIALFAFFFFLFSFMQGNLTVFYGIFFLMSVFGAGTLPVTFTRAINNNFESSRGLALGVALMGTGVTGFFITDMTQLWIDEYGWRRTFQILAMLPIFISLPVAYFWFRDPKEEKALSLNSRMDMSVVKGMTFVDALKDWRLHVIGVSFLFIGAAIAGTIPNVKFLLQDQGYTAQMSASRFIGVGLIGLSVLLGRGLGGFLVDKFWAPGVAFFMLILPAVSCLIFLQGTNPIWLNVLAIAFLGIAAGVEYDLMAFLVSRYFGMKAYGRVYGVLYAMFAIGAGLAPGLFGSVRDKTGSYDTILVLAAGLVFVGALMLLTIGKYRRFDTFGHFVKTSE
ncbi:MFS transporter [Hirschia litorea]|uniref:MFS transporter n=1 Tax=Hirschia litorea TaxID=1199156 RepID=A0ABW2IQ48_9PROT